MTLEPKLNFRWLFSASSLLIIIISTFYCNYHHCIQLNSKNEFGLYDFNYFKRIFNKSYRSHVEELVRNKIFLSRASRAFISSIAYKHRKVDYYLKINENSDWTNKEIESTTINNYQPLKRSFVSKKQKSNKKLLSEDEKLNYNKLIRKISNSNLNDKNKIHYYLPKLLKFNPSRKSILSNETNEALNEQTGSSDIETDDKIEDNNEIHRPDAVYIDLRKDDCFVIPKNQKKCGACYIFSTISAYEWLYCQQTGKKISFSEQYALDCSLSRDESHGCAGGNKKAISRFIDSYGLILSKYYPYREKNDVCPYNKSVDIKTMGFIKVKNYLKYDVDYKDVLNRLRESPVLISVALSEPFHNYGGGVFDGKECDHKRGHTMLLVGYGSENGEEYWLFRNSYGPSWGEEGYIKLNTKATNCWLVEPDSNKQYKALVIMPEDNFIRQSNKDLMFELNLDYDETSIKSHYQKYIHNLA